MGIKGAPDYYIRKGKSILLFESKDFLIRAEKKTSFDYSVYNAEFQRVLYYENLPNGKEKPKAIKQLINNIRTLLKSDFKADKDYRYKAVSVYPILITHDHQYDTPGFNNLLNFWFQKELGDLSNEGLFIHRIKPLTVINIDSIINHQVGLTKNMPLQYVIDAYHDYIQINPDIKFNTSAEAHNI